ncbi:hypothetical protein [Clostridium botulinum]|uniref:hypothetical protein n=1 Tax=Clostridium botulinum TaxID=1491 RepID=UPI0002074FFA|nr:hypothetical protein [Clostridium botulinum]AEB77646.1 hypothetical protein CbC4_7035 [Clostridium botulinum BKT015925]MCD3211064.1 hypothetical protein [Clostridium botulinum C/D]MCD3259830.1 hypothetical protein [Clostridium botulinum C/D]MCD3264974.1 hypothetical protein [Clostridium botulinum C/D]
MELQFASTCNTTRDENFLNETYSKEKAIKDELVILKKRLSMCEECIKEYWI